ncbi:MAG: indolepyruvate ferredoxin oxidoreductase subunit beta [Candidatus Asgardarchaeum californiense]|nr:MAG: indolepyruvate ferredoxin oxidoreductase subunit beta [Candidatus Asgardarchaeum californiense]
MRNKTSIVLSGVGGQGVITAANILGKAALRAKINVFTSEIHGMAQRGGTVNCTVRIGNISGPLVHSGCADVILSLEPIEALRYISYSNKKTKIITDVNPVIPFTVAIGGEKYPNLDDVFKELQTHAELHKIDALKIAKESGAIITKNIVMLGALTATNILPFGSEILLETILDNVPLKYKDINKKAFEGGMKALKD